MGQYKPIFIGEEVNVNQLESEILTFIEVLKKDPPNIVLELGTFRGGSLYMWTTVAKEGATLITVDMPACKHRDAMPAAMEDFIKSFGIPRGQEIHIVRGNSQTEETLGKVKAVLKGRPVDFLFIDADHTYKSVIRDFELYSPLVKKNGGIIAFHDIMPAVYCGYTFGVHTLWAELKKTYKYMEIVENRRQVGCGIGVLFTEES
jgi:cephalosporin hydroxylase